MVWPNGIIADVPQKPGYNCIQAIGSDANWIVKLLTSGTKLIAVNISDYSFKIGDGASYFIDFYYVKSQ